MTYSTTFSKQVINYVFLMLLISISSCNGQNKAENTGGTEQRGNRKKESAISFFPTNVTVEMDKNIRSIFQDKAGNYWFGTNAAGVYRYDGKILIQFTVKDGLSDNQVQHIQEDESGNIWFGTGAFGVSCFDAQAFTTFTNKEKLQLNKNDYNGWKIEPNDLWFFAGAGVYRYKSHSFVYLPLNKTNLSSPYTLSRYAVYSILKDKKGNLWFGTQAQGVCRYDGKTFTWFTENGLSNSAVLALFEDRNGNIWFGNNGFGVFRYDGKSVINFTEEKGLSNHEFQLSGKDGQGTLARIYSINEDKNGAIWIGTVDAGVWRYDGNNLTNYTIKDGLTSNAINTIYKDRNAELWFGTDDEGICKFNGKRFTKFEIK